MIHKNRSKEAFLELISKKDGKFYTGSTNDLKRRLDEHNGGKVESTKRRKPFLLIYFEVYSVKSSTVFLYSVASKTIEKNRALVRKKKKCI